MKSVRQGTDMSVKHVNRKRDVYFLHEGKTKTGKPKYFFSKESDGTLLDTIPEGYEVYENPNAQVFLRKIMPQVITNEEVQIVQAGLRKFAPSQRCIVDVKGEQIIVYKAQGRHFHQMLRFTLTDEKNRQFSAERWCFLGSIDDWFPLSDYEELSKLVEDYCRHLGRESFFELM